MTSGSGRDPRLPPGEVLASVLRRGVAAVLDLVLIALPVLVGAIVAVQGSSRLSDDEALVLSVLAAGVTVGYHTIAVATTGRTVGKLWMRCRVVRADDGGPVDWARAAIRAMVVALALAVPVLVIPTLAVVFGSARLDDLRRGLHDRAAGTIVVLD